MTYIVEFSYSVEELTELVNARLNQGYQLCGGVSVAHTEQAYDYVNGWQHDETTIWAQALTKE